MNIFDDDKTYIANTYARFNVQITKGSGCIATDSNGKNYIDMGAGIAVNTFGYCDEEWICAINEQLCKFQHTSNLYYSEPCVKLAKMLCEKTGMKKVFFSNSGAEANECAIKAARKYARETKGDDTYKILTLKNSFHGRTLTTLAATGQDVFHRDFLPLTDGFLYTDANDCEMLAKMCEDNKIAAIMIEMIQGEGGVNVLDKEFAACIENIAKKNDIIIINDEVQCGNGRTGKLYSYMHYPINPDIVTTAKGLCGGLPLGATMLSDKLKNIFSPGTHGSTFGANPVCCAGAVNVLSRLTPEFLDEVYKKGEYIKKSLENCEGIKDVCGMGLMIGIKPEKDAGEVIGECIKNGVLVLKAKDKVRLLPPLNIPQNLLDNALEVIKSACKN